MEALAAMALPHVLQAAYSTLTIAWTQYESVKEQKAQCTALLKRCTDLLLAVAKQSNFRTSNLMLAHVRSLENACAIVGKTIKTLAFHGFAWRLLHQSDIRMAISSAESALQTACDKFNISAHLGAHELQVEMTVARKRDQADLVARIDGLARNDQLILHTLQDGDQRLCRLEELVIAFTKHRRRRGNPDNGEMDTFIQAATSALQRLSKTSSAIEIPPWSLTSLEVTINRDGEDARLGVGSFGNVYRGEWNGQVVAVKEMDTQDARLLDEETLTLIRREIKIWSRLAHPHILPFYGSCLEVSQPFIVSKLCSNGNVIQYLKSNPHVNRPRLLHETALGMTYLHSMGVVHADLKGVNILISDNGKALICDFGLAKLEDELSTVGRRSSTRSREGTTRWMAPERLDGESLDFPSDVYSFGITAWEIYSGEIPFSGVPDRVIHRKVIDKKERPSRPETLTSDPLWNLIGRCWQPEPHIRPTFVTIQADIKQLIDSGAIPDEVLEIKDEDQLVAMHRLGVDRYRQNQFSGAEVLLRRVLHGREKLIGHEHEDTLSTMQWLARVYLKQRRYNDAETLFTHALAGQKKVLGTEHEDTLTTMHWFARVYFEQRRYDDAEILFTRSLAREEKVLGTEHANTLSTMHWLARVYFKQNRCDDAEILFTRSLAGEEKALGTEHAKTLSTMHWLACVYFERRQYNDAENMFTRTSAGREKVFGTEHEKTLSTMHWLARVYFEQRRYDDAEILFTCSLAREEKVLGTEHENTLSTMHWLARVYFKQNRCDDAEILFTRSLAGEDRVLGTEHENTLSTMYWLARVYFERKRYNDAEALFTCTLAGREKVLGTEHEKTWKTMKRLSDVYAKQQRHKDAKAMSKRVAAIGSGRR